MEDRFKFRFWNNKNMIYDDIPHLELYNSDDYVWQQCTGLKDKNGKLIYEGDIVNTNFYNEKAIIKYSKHFQRLHLHFIGEYRNHLKNPYGIHIFDWIYPKCQLEIIGNIYENKELLNA